MSAAGRAVRTSVCRPSPPVWRAACRRPARSCDGGRCVLTSKPGREDCRPRNPALPTSSRAPPAGRSRSEPTVRAGPCLCARGGSALRRRSGRGRAPPPPSAADHSRRATRAARRRAWPQAFPRARTNGTLAELPDGQHPARRQPLPRNVLEVRCSMELLRGCVAEAPTLLQNAAQCSEDPVGRRGGVAFGQLGADRGSVLVAESRPRELIGVEPAARRQFGDEVQSLAHRASRTGAE